MVHLHRLINGSGCSDNALQSAEDPHEVTMTFPGPLGPQAIGNAKISKFEVEVCPYILDTLISSVVEQVDEKRES